jgi:hypothetical protein
MVLIRRTCSECSFKVTASGRALYESRYFNLTVDDTSDNLLDCVMLTHDLASNTREAGQYCFDCGGWGHITMLSFNSCLIMSVCSV